MSLSSQLFDQLKRGAGAASRLRGAVIGLVTSNQDPEKLGRVQVLVPTMSEQDNTWWAPVISIGAGKDRGWFFIPEVDDEVVVMFEHGDMNHPVVVGSLWNGKDKPADQNDGKNERRVIKSRAGSRLIFDDDKGQLIVEDGAGKGRVTLDAKAKLITLEALSGDVCLQAPAGELSFVASKAVLKAGSNVELTAGTTMQWGSDAGATLKASGALSIDAPTVNIMNGGAPSPTAPSASPESVADPYGD